MPAGHCSTPHISTGQDLAQVGHVFSTVKYFIANQLSAIGTASQCSHVMSCLLCTCLLLSRALSSRLVLSCPILSSLVLSCWKCHCQFTASQFPKMSRFVSSCLVLYHLASSRLTLSGLILSPFVSFSLIRNFIVYRYPNVLSCPLLSRLVFPCQKCHCQLTASQSPNVLSCLHFLVLTVVCDFLFNFQVQQFALLSERVDEAHTVIKVNAKRSAPKSLRFENMI